MALQLLLLQYDLQRQRLFTRIDPDLEVYVGIIERNVMAGHAVDLVQTDIKRVFDTLRDESNNTGLANSVSDTLKPKSLCAFSRALSISGGTSTVA